MHTAIKKRWLKPLCALLLLAAGGAYLFYDYGQGSLDYLKCRLAFEYVLRSDSKEIKEEARSGLAGNYYFTSYYLNGILSAAEGTRSTRLLRMAMGYIDTMIATTGNFEEGGQVYHVWKPFTLDGNSTRPRPSLQYTFQATVPIARAAALIMADPQWRKKYGADARRYVEFVDQYVFRYWYHLQLKDTIPWINHDIFPVWHGNSSNLALNAAFLYQATGNTSYRDIGLKIGTSFKAKLKPYGNGWIWDDHTLADTEDSAGNLAGVPDTSHANREAFMMVTLYESGILFTRDDISRMSATFSSTLWNQSALNPAFANYINGSDKPYGIYNEPGFNGSIYHGWALTGGYSPKAQSVLLNTIDAMLHRRMNPSMERNIISYGGRISLCGHTLRNFRLLRNPGARGR